jgi:NADH dehydrogenase
VIWAAGIKANTIEGFNYATARGNRIVVDELNRINGNNDIYAIGDVAAMVQANQPYGHPQVAPVAIQQADNLAWNIAARYNGVAQEHLKPFKYFDKGSMATIGRNLAVVDVPFPKLSIGGLMAWLIWMFLHLFLILGVKNKFFVFTNWVYNYFTYDQSLRLIFKDYHRD